MSTKALTISMFIAAFHVPTSPRVEEQCVTRDREECSEVASSQCETVEREVCDTVREDHK